MPDPSILAGKTGRLKEMHWAPIEQAANIRAIIENYDGYVWSIDSNLQYIFLNTALRDLIRETLDVDAQPGHKMLDILKMVDDSQPKEWNDIYELGFAGERQWFVSRLLIGGQPAYYDISINPIREDDAVTGLCCFARNITEQVINERKLQASEVRFRSLIENSSDIIVVLNAEGRIIYGSPSIEKMFGISTGEYFGSSAFEFIHPEDIPELSLKFAELLEQPGATIAIRTRAHTKDGRQIWTEGMVSNLLGTEGVNGIVCNFRDVTESVQAAEALQKSELKFRTLIENSADLIMMVDATGNFIYGSPSVEKYLGYTEADYLHRYCLMFVHPGSLATATELLSNIFEHPGKLFTIYLTLMHKNGSEIWVEGLATNMLHVPGINALVANFRDISERKKAERKIRESEDLYRNLFNKSPLPMWVCEYGTLNILEVNEAAMEHYGYSRKEFLKMTAFGIVPVEEHMDLKKMFSKVSKGKHQRVIRKHLKKNKEIIHAEVLLHALNYNGENSILMLANDITEKILLQNQLMNEKIHRQQEISKATIDAQENERESIGRELHDNVTQILTTARLFLSCAGNDPVMQHDMIRRSTRNITTAIEEIRKLSKSMIQAFHKEIGLKLSIEDLVESIQLSNKFSIYMDYSVPEEQQLDDKLKMTVFRIIQEQLNNIIKHSCANRILITIKQSAELLQIYIADNGVGFNKKEKRKGIGITNIINRAELFNGTVDIDSAPGKGCRIKVNFRISQASSFPSPVISV